MTRKISDVMPQRAPVALPPGASVRDAVELMCRENIGSVLVIETGRLEGIFTERDVLCRVIAQGHDPGATSLAEVMTATPDTVAPENMAIDGLHKMHDGGYRHLPVVSDGHIIGVISRRDFGWLEEARLEEETQIWERI